LIRMQPMLIIHFLEILIKARSAKTRVNCLKFCEDAGEKFLDCKWGEIGG
jgi:hypothetical protein